MECYNVGDKSRRWYAFDTMLDVLYRVTNYHDRERLFSATMFGRHAEIIKHVCRIFFMDVVLVN